LTRVRVLIPAVLIATFAVIAVAVARDLSSAGSLSDYRLEAGAPADVSFNTSFGRSLGGELHGLELDLPRGFAFDPRAARACSLRQARIDACSNDSRVGAGAGRIVVQGRYLPRTTYDVKVAVYLTAAPRHGDLAGMLFDVDEPQSQLSVSLLGSVTYSRSGPYGVRLRFSSDGHQHPGEYELTLSELQLALGARRTGATGAAYNLLTNPRSCTAPGWPLSLTVSSSAGPRSFRVASPCQGHG
jgi:hypothetical protein